ncbi:MULTISPECIES: SDR family NAD(P)-dependent oxidoreductase [unclassified Microbacterium]|uniref:SDR family NAD(P)-dependent oxidoreductase n=1 Tax=unclassified Microbacterium TaxID=2609290 RepID=UPI0016053E55|nr:MULTISPECIES: SDR family NAD(P)-dependent oxidoreductase [unclassified Microbacterium]QNA93531.1 SDR family oxidoreductase [Microbacterium sp. Se63.02b]QYM63780.1 SDR family oxidoreductase [Microbacterium sp. Se5.02b]
MTGIARFHGRTALITGGASGIGAAVCRRFVDEGARVAIADIDLEAAQALAASIGGRSAVAIRLDVTRPDEWVAATEQAVAFGGGLDVLHHNAGRTEAAPIDGTPDAWSAQLDLNLGSAFLAVKATLPALVRSTDAAIVFTSSIHAVQGFPGVPAYAAAKAGMVGLARQLAVDLAGRVRVNTVAPGVVETEAWAALDDSVRRSWRETSPAGRATTPENVAATVAFLASADAQGITGQTVVVDSGASIWGRAGS